MAKRATLKDRKVQFEKSGSGSFHPLDSFVAAPGGQVVELLVDAIKPNPDQPRRHFDRRSLSALATSIKEKGLRNPIHVRREGESYILIEGERRWRAHREAEIKRIQAFVDNVDPEEAFELALIENMQREDLTPLEEAAGVEELIRRRGYKQREVAKILGKSESEVSELRRLNKLPQQVREKLQTSEVAKDQYFQVSRLKTETAQEKLTDRIVEEGLNVRETRKTVGHSKEKKEKNQHPVIGRIGKLKLTLSKLEVDKLEADERKELAAQLKELVAEIEGVRRLI